MDLRLSLSELSIMDESRAQIHKENGVVALGLGEGGQGDAGAAAAGESAATMSAERRSRVRKAYSGRSSKFLGEEVVGKQKLRGPSGAHLPTDQQTKPIHMLDSLKREPATAVATAAAAAVSKFSAAYHSQQHQPTPQGLQGSSDMQQDSLYASAGDDLDRKPNYWTPSEDAALKAAVERFGDKSWKNIAASVPGRTSTQCIQRWKKVLKPGLKKGHWSAEEDSLLVAGVRTQQSKNVKRLNWSEVAKTIPMRSCKQCRERWVNHLNPDVNKSSWTPEEDQRLLDLQELTPRKWAKIARQIPGRTENMVKVRWNILDRQKNRHDGGFQHTSPLTSLCSPPSLASSTPSPASTSPLATTVTAASHSPASFGSYPRSTVSASVKSEPKRAVKSPVRAGSTLPGTQGRKQNTILLKRDFGHSASGPAPPNGTQTATASSSREAPSGSSDFILSGAEWDPEELLLMRPLDFDPSERVQFGVAPPDYPATLKPTVNPMSATVKHSMGAASAISSHGHTQASAHATASLHHQQPQTSASRPGGSSFASRQQAPSPLVDILGQTALEDLAFDPIDFGDLHLDTRPNDMHYSNVEPAQYASRQESRNAFGPGPIKYNTTTQASAATATARAGLREPRFAPANTVAATSKAAYQHKLSADSSSSFRRSIGDFKSTLPRGNSADMLELVPQSFDDLGIDDDSLSKELNDLLAHPAPSSATGHSASS